MSSKKYIIKVLNNTSGVFLCVVRYDLHKVIIQSSPDMMSNAREFLDFWIGDEVTIKDIKIIIVPDIESDDGDDDKDYDPSIPGEDWLEIIRGVPQEA